MGAKFHVNLKKNSWFPIKNINRKKFIAPKVRKIFGATTIYDKRQCLAEILKKKTFLLNLVSKLTRKVSFNFVIMNQLLKRG